MTYNFKTEYARDLHTRLSTIVPIIFIRDNDMVECARMDFHGGNQPVKVKYKSTADEIVDIAHELLHVRMQLQDGFPLLAWPDNLNPTPEIKDAVKRIRDAVDDTYVLHQLFTDTGRLPVSEVFYREVRRDLKKGFIQIVRSVPSVSRPLETAWRLRLADLSCSAYGKCLTTNQRQLAGDFLSRFQGKDPAASHLFMYLKQNVLGVQLCDPHQLGCVLISLRDKLDLPSWLHLATWQQINSKWVLKK